MREFAAYSRIYQAFLSIGQVTIVGYGNMPGLGTPGGPKFIAVPRSLGGRAGRRAGQDGAPGETMPPRRAGRARR
jgi:hypothetical protein